MAGMIVRLLGIAVCAAAWWWLGARGLEKGSILPIFAAHGVLIVAAILLAKPLAGLIGDWFSGLFVPRERFAKPQPMYSIPEGRMAAENYPGTPKTGTVIKGVEKAAALADTLVFHAGTKQDGANIIANGGRVLAVTGLGKSVAEAQKRAYDAVDTIDWPGGFCRRDIGHRAIGR